MSMSNMKQLLRTVAKSHVGVKAKNSTLYCWPAKYIIRGLVFERGFGGYYITRYFWPTFCNYEFRHLGFSERFAWQDGFITADEVAQPETLKRISALISKYTIPMSNDVELVQCREIIDQKEYLWYGRYALVCLEILSGNNDEAQNVISKMISEFSNRISEPIMSRINTLNDCLSGPDPTAGRLILSWMDEELAYWK